jgi:CheY-like chemotaxis protein
MEETEKEIKRTGTSNAGQAIAGRILVAEDNKSIQEIVSRLLKFMGFEVALAGNGFEALLLFIGNSFDLVLTDLEMPIMDGLSLAGHIRERSPSTPIILLTGSDRETVRKKVETGPFDSVIFKPFRLEDLTSTVRGALAPREGGHGSVGMR